MIERIAQTGFWGANGVGPSINSHAGGLCDAAFVLTVDTSLVHTVDSITYGGVAMTKLVTYGSGITHIVSIWGLQNPPIGLQNVAITGNNSEYAGQIEVATYKGVSKMATFPDAFNSDRTAFGDGVSNVTVPVTTSVDDCVLLGVGFHNGTDITENNPGTATSRFAFYSPFRSGFDAGAFESNPLDTGTAGVKTMQMTCGAINQELVLVTIAIAPSLVGNNISNIMII